MLCHAERRNEHARASTLPSLATLIIRQSKWSRGTRGSMIIHTILAPESFDVGDIMRQLDADHMIQSDFM